MSVVSYDTDTIDAGSSNTGTATNPLNSDIVKNTNPVKNSSSNLPNVKKLVEKSACQKLNCLPVDLRDRLRKLTLLTFDEM